MTLTDFLLARIAEDEAVAAACVSPTWSTGPYVGLPYYAERGENELIGPRMDEEEGRTLFTRSDAEHIARHDPARVLAECAAYRRIVELHPPRWQEVEHPRRYGETEARVERVAGPFYDDEIYALAAIYSDHPDYREEWRP